MIALTFSLYTPYISRCCRFSWFFQKLPPFFWFRPQSSSSGSRSAHAQPCIMHRHALCIQPLRHGWLTCIADCGWLWLSMHVVYITDPDLDCDASWSKLGHWCVATLIWRFTLVCRRLAGQTTNAKSYKGTGKRRRVFCRSADWPAIEWAYVRPWGRRKES
jgi:hypothetical protein